MTVVIPSELVHKAWPSGTRNQIYEFHYDEETKFCWWIVDGRPKYSKWTLSDFRSENYGNSTYKNIIYTMISNAVANVKNPQIFDLLA